MIRYAIACLLLVLLAGGMPSDAAPAGQQRQVAWQGLSAILGHKVRLVMPDGARIEGKAAKVEVDALAVEIYKSSNMTAYPKGNFLVPRATLRAIDVVEPSTKYWRITGVAAGAAVGFLFAVGAVDTAKSSGVGGKAAALGAAAGAMPVLGYFVGRAADRRIVTYVITQ